MPLAQSNATHSATKQSHSPPRLLTGTPPPQTQAASPRGQSTLNRRVCGHCCNRFRLPRVHPALYYRRRFVGRVRRGFGVLLRGCGLFFPRYELEKGNGGNEVGSGIGDAGNITSEKWGRDMIERTLPWDQMHRQRQRCKGVRVRYLLPRRRSPGPSMFNQQMSHTDLLGLRIRRKIRRKITFQGIRIGPARGLPSRLIALQVEVIGHVLCFRYADLPLWGKTRGLTSQSVP